jgi:hypothetical protein
MKNFTCLFIAALALNFAHAQVSEPAWNATVTVLDETGQPVARANVKMSFNVKTIPGESESGGNVQGLTDTNGIVLLSHPNTGSIGVSFQATKGGYYATTKGHEFVEFKDGDPEKWNPTITLILKKIGSPIPMYAKYVENGPPVFNEPVGYDLMIGDWVAPHGKGQIADIIFTGQLDKKSKNDFDYKLTVSFPKSGDGIQEFTVPPTRFAGQGSGLRSPHEAPADGYQSQVIRTMSRHPGQQSEDDHDGNRNYFFRVRTVLNENGNVKSALYGKIYGDFMQFTYYLNPTPNDRNVEFDPKKNLLGGLKSFEGVSAP